jgi:hypothetical protein
MDEKLQVRCVPWSEELFTSAFMNLGFIVDFIYEQQV